MSLPLPFSLSLSLSLSLFLSLVLSLSTLCQKKRYSLRKTKALSKKLKKVNLTCSIIIHFKDSNKCAVLDFINSDHYTGEEDSNTNTYSLSRQVSVRSSPLLKDISNESLHKALSVDLNILTKNLQC